MKRCEAIVSSGDEYDEDVIVNCKSEMRLQTPETIEDKVETDSLCRF
jgi:hypothetical protein